MTRLARLLERWPVEQALRAACVLGLGGLSLMVLGVVFATPLPVVAAMTVAQLFGALAGLLFAVSIAADAIARRP